jgi:hypothetical protein
MLFSSVTPLPGTDLSHVIRVLETQAQSLANLQGTGAYDRLSAYQDWASQASSQLRYVLDLDQVERLIDTRRHDFLFDMFGGPQALLNYSISAEQEDRARVFGEALDRLRAIEASCAAMPKALLIADTNIYLHQDLYFHELNWRDIAATSEGLRVLIPMAVMREIDKAKRAPGNKTVSFTNKEAIRDRARLASKRIRTSFENPESIPELATKVSMELLMDPRGHIAIEDSDSEIIDRALALQTMAGRKVSIVTTDGNMQFGAHVAGLGAILLPD